MAGTMEEKIYNRQVSKLSLALRVVDEKQIQRYYDNKDLADLYNFNSLENEQIEFNLIPNDNILKNVIDKHKNLIYNIIEHDSLLQNKVIFITFTIYLN